MKQQKSFQNVFNTTQFNNVPSNIFDLGYDHKFSLNMGDLVPIHIQECLPGDKFNHSIASLLRFAPLVAPAMHNVDVFTHTFFIPNRIIWPNWEKFITGGQNPEDTPAMPVTNPNVVVNSMGDYFGLPLGQNPMVSAFAFASYNKVFNDWYRDQNLVAELKDELVDGLNNPADFVIQKRAWEHDYFTSCLPFAQKGPQVSLPVGNFNDVSVLPTSPGVGAGWKALNPVDNTPVSDDPLTTVQTLGEARVMSNTERVKFDPNGTLFANTSELVAGAATINNFRVALRLQEWFEKNARGGSRYIESMLVHFGVKSSDARLQRSEYIGGTKQPMVISEVLQTSESSSTPQANMAGHGVSVGNGKRMRYYCEEHGYILTLMSIRPRTAYMQGIPRHFSRTDRYDFAWPSFAHLGEQEVLSKEIYYNHAQGSANNALFGYLPRYSEYRYNPSKVSGEFRTSLKFWTLVREFSNRPLLNKTFIECNPSSRIFAVEDETADKIYAHVFHSIKVARKLPKFSNPSL